jgi:hypothetical protein
MPLEDMQIRAIIFGGPVVTVGDGVINAGEYPDIIGGGLRFESYWFFRILL